MSLDWNAEAIANIDALLGKNDKFDLLLETAVFLSMSLGMSSITKQNYKEWFRRAWTWEAVQGAARNGVGGSDVFFTEAEVYSLVGLKTNAEHWAKNKFTTNVKGTALRNAIKHRERTRGEKQPK
jgi:hypothetical protein